MILTFYWTSQKDGEKVKKRKVFLSIVMHLNSIVFIILFLEALVKEISWKLDVIRNLNIHALQQISLFLLPCFVR